MTHPMTPDEIAKLKALAEAATPGEWVYAPDDEGSSMGAVDCSPDAAPPHGYALFEVLGDSAQQAMNAAYIAAANPETVLALISELAALRANIIPDDGGEPFTVTVWQALDQLKDMQNFMKEVDLKHAAGLAALKAQGTFNEGVEALLQTINKAPNGLTEASILKEFVRVIRPTTQPESKEESK